MNNISRWCSVGVALDTVVCHFFVFRRRHAVVCGRFTFAVHTLFAATSNVKLIPSVCFLARSLLTIVFNPQQQPQEPRDFDAFCDDDGLNKRPPPDIMRARKPSHNFPTTKIIFAPFSVRKARESIESFLLSSYEKALWIISFTNSRYY